LARMSMMSLPVSIVEFLTLFSLSASHFKPLLFHLTFALRLALSAVCSVRGDLRCYVGSEGCLRETTYRAPLPWQVRADLPVPWWDRLAGKSFEFIFLPCSFPICPNRRLTDNGL
jgi:hypothetical protein